MRKDQVVALLIALNQAHVKYLLVGGLAVIAHGYVRTTMDMDLVLAMDNQNLGNAVDVLQKFGYRPIVPVPLKDLVDDAKRKIWIEEKNALALNLIGPKPGDLVVDILFQFPFDFDAEWNKSCRTMIDDAVEAPYASLETMIVMKTQAQRPKDQDDLLQLRRIQALRDENERSA